MKKKTITILFPEKSDISTLRERTADMARLLSPYSLRSRAATRLHAVANRLQPAPKRTEYKSNIQPASPCEVIDS